MLDALATIITPWFDHVAWNVPATRILPDFLGHGPGPHNLLRYLFVDPELSRLVDDLRDRSADFATRWARHEVAPWKSMSPAFVHPEVGRLAFRGVRLLVADNPDLQVVLFPPADHGDTRAKLDHLARAEAGRGRGDRAR